MQLPVISVAICTYNRADRLGFVLEGLCQQSLPFEQFEVLLIDNASQDNTQAIALDYQAKLPNLHYLYEPVQGLSRARNTALQKAQGAYIAYIDDDAIPTTTWLEQILQTFTTVEPHPVGVGGPIEPLWETPKPDWMHPYLEDLYSALNLGDQPQWFRPPKFPYGTNMAYQREAVCQVGGFCEDLGRQGANLLSEEERLLNWLLAQQGGQFYYNPQVRVQHWVPAKRINPRWLMQRIFWQGRSVALVDLLVSHSLQQQRWSSTRTLFSLANAKRLLAQFLPDRKVRIRTWAWLMRDYGYFYQSWFGCFPQTPLKPGSPLPHLSAERF